MLIQLPINIGIVNGTRNQVAAQAALVDSQDIADTQATVCCYAPGSQAGAPLLPEQSDIRHFRAPRPRAHAFRVYPARAFLYRRMAKVSAADETHYSARQCLPERHRFRTRQTTCMARQVVAVSFLYAQAFPAIQGTPAADRWVAQALENRPNLEKSRGMYPGAMGLSAARRHLRLST